MLSRYSRAAAVDQTTRRAAWNPDAILLPPQRAVRDDPARLRLVDGPRRIGKSKLAAVLLLDEALTTPRAKCLFLALTREDAQDIVWQELLELNEDYALGGVPNEQKLELVFPNRSRVRVGGAKDRQQAERRRGRFYQLVIIDECQTFPSHLYDLVESILKPSLLGKGRRGRIILMGTPAEVPGVGYWEEKVADPKWSKHTWTIYDNTWLGTREEIDEFLRDMAESMGGEDDPRFQREYLGRRVPPRNMDRPYIYDATKQHFTAPILESVITKELRFRRWALPWAGMWYFVKGIDLGDSACSAIAVWGTSDARPGKIVLVEEFLAPRMLPDTLWAKIVERRAFYGAGPLDAERFGVVGAQSAGVLEMAVDEGALGSMIAEQWRQPPYALPVTAAEKTAIEVQADFLSAAMNRGDVLISKFSVMAADMAVARWDEKKLREQHKRVEAKTPHSDIIPAGRYGFKKIHAIATSLRAPTAAPTVEQKESTELERERREGAEKARRLMEGRPVIGASRREAVDRWRR